MKADARVEMRVDYGPRVVGDVKRVGRQSWRAWHFGTPSPVGHFRSRRNAIAAVKKTHTAWLRTNRKAAS